MITLRVLESASCCCARSAVVTSSIKARALKRTSIRVFMAHLVGNGGSEHHPIQQPDFASAEFRKRNHRFHACPGRLVARFSQTEGVGALRKALTVRGQCQT